ncbi:GNAT family N-acetyltransferase [Aspergillus ibericus CBS 121593]|uniref:N-acetyltransferase domain-containing protein n=1 Tax=Aspergillus ibericus CBS 121593 TaxID=1448316 RepID=A0A395HDR6_9EURO|nr:hypothetical protein BO80DRAFT_440843 [Aspergillus ibericus CBS 121593]RAL05245.1 hypothetical protein BO80DRAFT_440843 [Aspergillus ibericus CBS 121593]
MALITPAISMLETSPTPVATNSRVEIHDSKDPTSSDRETQVVVKLPTTSTTIHDTPRRAIPRPSQPLYRPPRQRNSQRQSQDQSFLPRRGKALGSEYQYQRKVAHSFSAPLFSYASKETFEAGPSTVTQKVDRAASSSPAVKNPEQAASPEDKQVTKRNMSSTNGSDEIVLRDFRNKDKQRNVEETLPHTKNTSLESNVPEVKGESAAEREKRPPREEVRAELDRLKKQALVDYAKRQEEVALETADPAILAKCRDGPGVDPDSEIYAEIAKRRRVRPVEEADLNVEPPSRPESSGEEEKLEDDSLSNLEELEASFEPEKLSHLWDAYANDLVLYPKVINGQVTLATEPTEAQRELQKKFKVFACHPHASQDVNKLPPYTEDLDWQLDSHLCNWWFVPPNIVNVDEWKRSLRRWLDNSIVMSCYIDQYHKSYFDGTAHPDGSTSFYIPDLPDHTTILDPSDEKGRLHRCETAEGYCKNLVSHIKKEEKDEAQRLMRVRRANEAFLANREVNPNTPKANIYLRPAQMKDVPQLLLIYNRYARESCLSIHTQDLKPDYVRGRIQAAKSAQLPFLVAVERGSRREREAIFGYATATEYSPGQYTTGRFTAQLEVFVLPEHQKKGIGYCLLDKLLQICDPAYCSKEGYTFDNRGVGGYSLGGERVLARLLFIMTILPEDVEVHSWTRKWLEKYGFEVQGQLKGAASKFDRLLDVFYLVRKTTFVLNYR